jgi:hypothetical protein
MVSILVTGGTGYIEGKRQIYPTLTAKNIYEIILLKEGSHKWIKSKRQKVPTY